jgi:hypothetical protein
MPRTHSCPRCRKNVAECGCDPLAIVEGRLGIVSGSIHYVGPLRVVDARRGAEVSVGFGGFDRPPHIVESVNEVEARYDEGKRQPLLVCAYCDARERLFKRQDAVRWFLTHSCSGEGAVVDVSAWQSHDDPEEAAA